MYVDAPNILACCDGRDGIYLDATKIFIRSCVARLVESFERVPKDDPNAVFQSSLQNQDLIFLPTLTGRKKDHQLTTIQKVRVNKTFTIVRQFIRDATGATQDAVTKGKKISTGEGVTMDQINAMAKLLKHGGRDCPLPEPWGARLQMLSCFLDGPFERRQPKKPMLLVVGQAKGSLLRHLGGRYPADALLWGKGNELRDIVNAKQTTDLDGPLNRMRGRCWVLHEYIMSVTADRTRLVPFARHDLLLTIASLADAGRRNPPGREPAGGGERVLNSPAWSEFDFTKNVHGVEWSDGQG
jgi:hypothetical protein